MFNADFNAYLSWITEAGLLNSDFVRSSNARNMCKLNIVVNDLVEDVLKNINVCFKNV